jgi:putative transposase
LITEAFLEFIKYYKSNDRSRRREYMAMPVKAVRVVSLRELYQEVTTQDIFRVVYSGFGQDCTYLCNAFGERLDIRKYPTEEFLGLSDPEDKNRQFVKYELDPFAVPNWTTKETPGQSSKSAENWNVIGPLIERFDDQGRWEIRQLLERNSRNRCLVEYAEERGFGVPLLYKLLRRYLQRGMSEFAVASQYANCGALRTNAMHVDGVSSDGPIKSTPIVKKYQNRPGPAPGDTSFTYALPGPELEKLINQHLDIYTTWREGVWSLPSEASALGRRLRKRKRHENGLLKMEPKRAVRGRMPSKDHRPARGHRSKPTFQDLADSINYQLRRTLEVWENGRLKKLVMHAKDVVTTRQIQWAWSKCRPSFVRRRSKHPHESEIRRPSPGPGRARQHIKGPGQQFMIDSTVLDIYVVSPQDRKLVLGRPTLYLIVDLFSGLIVGLYLGLENPSREACSMALVSMVTNKREFCARYGFDIKESDWPACYLPFELVADRGAELRNAEPWTTIGRTLGVGISNAPARRPRWRGLGERRFGSVPRGYQKAAYGVVEKDFNTRTGRYYAWDARYTCAEVILMMLRAIHDYHRTPVSGDQPPPVEMVLARLANTPLNRWNWGIQNCSGMLKTATPEEVRLAVWPKGQARVYADGICWKGAWYQSVVLRDEFWNSPHGKGRRRSRSVEIQYDPADMSEIRLPLYGYSQVCLLDANRNAHQLAGVSLAEWLDQRALDRVNRRAKLMEEQAQRYITQQNTQIGTEFAAQEQRAQLRAADMKHPDASSMRQARAAQRKRDAKARLASQDDETQEASNESKRTRSPQGGASTEQVEEFVDPLRDAIFGDAN